MARLNAIHSGMGFYSTNAGPFTNFAGAFNRGDFYAENVSVGTRFGSPATYASTFTYGLTNGTVVNVVDVWFCARFRVRRIPLIQSQVMQWGMTTVANAMHCDVTTGGLLSFYNAAGTGNLIASSIAIPIGNTQAEWTTIQGRIRTDSGVANQARLTLIVNGATIFDTGNTPGLIPGAGVGLNAAGSLNNVVFSVPGATANAVEYDFDQYIADNTDLPTPSRWTYIRPSGIGNYNNWAGGITDFRDKLVTRSLSANPLSTAVLSSRQSYTIPTPLSLGVTGTIKSISISGYTGNCPVASTITYFFRKGGIDTDCGATNATDAAERIHRAYFSSPGWANTDVLEIGFMSGSVAGTYRHQYVGVWIEHDTPFVVPFEDPVIIQRGNYTGNGTFLTVVPPFPFTFAMISARLGTGAMAYWSKGMDAFCTVNNTGVNIGAWSDGTRIELNGNVASFNTGAAVYDVLYVQDLENRVIGDGSFFQLDLAAPVDTQNYQVRTPMASPEGLILQQYLVGSASANITAFHNPGMGTNLAKNFGAGVLAANIVNQLIATGFEVRKGFLTPATACQFPFIAFKPSGASSVVLTAIVQYTGDGLATQVVPLPTLGVQTPFWGWVFPHNSISAHSRNNQQANTFPIIGGAGIATGITAFGAGSITVGSTLNTGAVVYTIVAFVEGTDASAANQYSGIYFIDPTARHDTLWDRTGAPFTVNQAIPQPIYRTHFIGDSNG